MKKWKKGWIVTLCCLVSILRFALPAWSANIYVSPTGGGVGSSASPTDLQDALDTARTNGTDDTIYLQGGTYDASTSGEDTFEYGSVSNDGMKVTLSGSWNSSYTTQKTTEEPSTTLDGGGTSRVLDINADAVSFDFAIEYLNIDNGYLAAGNGHGVGIRAENENSGEINLTILHVGFDNNTAEIAAGGAYGGGMWANCYFEISECRFTNNHAYYAGAMNFSTADNTVSPKIDDCYFEDNLAGKITTDPGYISTINFSNSPIITNSTFIGDSTATWTGSGLNSSGGNVTLINCVFSGFRSWFWSGAVSLWDSSATITNCLFYDNKCGYQGSPSGGGGGAIGIYDPTPGTPNTVTITNSTFVGNHTVGIVPYGGAIHNRVQTLSVINSIFWDNGTYGLYEGSGTATASYSDIQGGLAGTNVTDGGNNITTDPSFVYDSGDSSDPSTWDLQLQFDSPCIDTGNNAASNLSDPDLNDNPRLWDGDRDGTDTVDMGSYEFGSDTGILQVTTTSDSDCADYDCDLQSALTFAASAIGLNKEIRVAQGTYTGNFTYSPVADNHGNLAILGGWSSDFSKRTLDPTNTILDGNNTFSPLTLNNEPNETTGGLKVEGLTLKNGLLGLNKGGGGLYAVALPPGDIDIQHNIIEENTAGQNGGGICAIAYDTGSQSGGTINIANNIIRTNTAGSDTDQGSAAGGGVFTFSAGSVLLANNLIYDNVVGSDTVDGRGGGVFLSAHDGGVYLTNNTIVTNEATTEAGGVYLTEAPSAWDQIDFQVYNNIIGSAPDCVECKEDMVNDISATFPSSGSSLIVSYNNVELVTTSGSVTPTKTNNFSGDPMFVSESAGKEDYHLRKGSPCVDAGTNAAPNMPATDIEGEIRPQDGDKDGTATANMGCYETLGGSFSWNMFLPAITGGAD